MTRPARDAAILGAIGLAVVVALFWTPVLVRAVYHAMIGV